MIKIENKNLTRIKVEVEVMIDIKNIENTE